MSNTAIPKVPSIPFLGSALQMVGKNPRTYLLKQFNRLGPIYRLKVMHLDYLILAGPKANKFAGEEGIQLLASKAFWKEMLHELEAENFLMALDGPDHLMLRKLFRKNFSKINIDPNLNTLDELCSTVFNDIKLGQPFPVVDRILQLTSQMIGNVMTGEIPDRKELEHFLYYINSITNHFALNKLPKWMLKLKGSKFKKAKSLTFNFAENVVEKHLTKKNDLDNFVSAVIQAAEKCPHLFSHGDIRFSAMLPLFAGIDTLGQTINYALFELHKNPSILSQLQKEIDTQWAIGVPDTHALKSMETLNNVVRETLRLHPAAFGMVRTATQDFEFEGYQIKKGAHLVILTTATHFMDEFFKAPNSFDIDRYAAPRNEHRQRDVFAPFGKGPHTCLGAGLAETLMKIALGSILYHYQFEPLDPKLIIKEKISPTPSLGKDFKLKILNKRTR